MLIDEFDEIVKKVTEIAERRTCGAPDEFAGVFAHLFKKELLVTDSRIETLSDFKNAVDDLPDCISFEKAVKMVSVDLGNSQTHSDLSNISRSLKQLASDIDELT